MEIREAKEADLDQLNNLFDSYRVFYKQPSDKEKSRAFLQTRLRNNESVIYVAEESGALLGFVQLYPIFSSTRLKRVWLLNDLFVSEHARGQGISKLLIDKAKELVNSTKALGLILETEKTNKVGNSLYKSTDFELDSEHNYYSWTE